MSQTFDQINYKFKTNFVKVYEYDVAYIDEGSSSDVLLFIHGLGSYLKAWDRNITVLKNSFRCIAVDLPGYGKSSKQIHNGTVEFYREFLNEFIKILDLHNITLVGHSMGGQIALSYVINFPDIIKKLILAAPAGFETFKPNEIEQLKSIISPEISYNTSDEQIRINYKTNFYQMPIEAEEMIADRITIKNDEEFFNHCQIVANSLTGLLAEQVFNQLNKINIPTLIFFGKNDLLIPNRIHYKTSTEEIAKLGASQIRNSRLLLLENCGHFLQYEIPEIFNSTVIDFIASNK
ncbi:MAG: alpha/beta hydrolase [Ignavibacterium sp.]|jgi:pimeloyl-ACP methyl ester carboxylesterase|nr:alpha/beta hydrolase [Ignavibacterium sp.]